ncbi:hypothetical protein CBR_g38240 [Chara braunii]|uniref:Pentacotripeptide-repeat region of PRORP domain-containing protein n=1 Tax=Chara braunii TaxID=69332 RepID=A0A388LPS7_CHABU|nr:hypothetical protein CBR_g38240 [Chara braunii]|eukprot:GBG84269.1 hypothetical protein CBR_g38240 [Chara braunii]
MAALLNGGVKFLHCPSLRTVNSVQLQLQDIFHGHSWGVPVLVPSGFAHCHGAVGIRPSGKVRFVSAQTRSSIHLRNLISVHSQSASRWRVKEGGKVDPVSETKSLPTAYLLSGQEATTASADACDTKVIVPDADLGDKPVRIGENYLEGHLHLGQDMEDDSDDRRIELSSEGHALVQTALAMAGVSYGEWIVVKRQQKKQMEEIWEDQDEQDDDERQGGFALPPSSRTGRQYGGHQTVESRQRIAGRQSVDRHQSIALWEAGMQAGGNVVAAENVSDLDAYVVGSWRASTKDQISSNSINLRASGHLNLPLPLSSLTSQGVVGTALKQAASETATQVGGEMAPEKVVGGRLRKRGRTGVTNVRNVRTRDTQASRRRMEISWLRLIMSVGNVSGLEHDAERVDVVSEIMKIMYACARVRVNARHVAAAVTVCIRAKDVVRGEEILLEAQRKGGSATPNAFAYGALIHGYCKMGQRRAAFALLSHMRDAGVAPDESIFNTLLEFEECPEGVAIVLGMMSTAGVKPTERTYSAAIRGCGRAGSLSDVRELWVNMERAGIKGTLFTYNSLLDAYACMGETEQCYDVLEKMKIVAISPDLRSFNTIMKAHAHASDAEGALALLQGMKAAKVSPDIVTYNIAMDACVRGRKLDRCLKLQKDAVAGGCALDATSFAIMLRAAGHLRNIRPVERLWAEMKEQKIRPDAVTYRCAIHAFIRCGEGGPALQILEEMTSLGFPPALHVANVLIKSVDAALLRECTAVASSGRLGEFLSSMAAAGLSATPATAASIVKKIAKSNGIVTSINVAQEFQRAGIKGLGDDVWGVLIDMVAAMVEDDPTSALSAADKLLALMKEDGSGLSRKLYEARLMALAKRGDAGGVLKLMAEMDAVCGPQTDAISGPVGRLLLDTMDAALTQAIAGKIVRESNGEDGDTEGEEDVLPTSLVDSLASSGIVVKPEAMAFVIQKMFSDSQSGVANGQASQQKEGVGRNAHRQEAPVPGKQVGRCETNKNARSPRSSRLDKALALVDNMPKLLGVKPTSFVYASLMEVCLREGQGQRIEQLWARMRSEGVTPDSATWVVRVKALQSVHGKVQGRVHTLLLEAAADGLELDIPLLKALMRACKGAKDRDGCRLVAKAMNAAERRKSRQLDILLRSAQKSQSASDVPGST